MFNYFTVKLTAHEIERIGSKIFLRKRERALNFFLLAEIKCKCNKLIYLFSMLKIFGNKIVFTHFMILEVNESVILFIAFSN